MGSPLFMAVAFCLIGIWIVLLAIPGFRRPPPGFEPKICPACKRSNDYLTDHCHGCGTRLDEAL